MSTAIATTAPITIHCRCGAVEISITGAPVAQFYCHCGDCQVVHGGAYVPESAYPKDAVQIVKGEVSRWALKRNPRVTCIACGTRLFIEVAVLGLRGVNGYLLPNEAFSPTFHMHCREARLPVKDDLPHYKSRPPQFAGSDERVDW